MSEVVRVLGISGSLRKGSFNTALLRAAIAQSPPGLQIEVASLADIPPYNEDVRAQGFPSPVAKLRDQIAAADALLIVTPEYNYSIPGVLKNAIDWASRPPDQPFAGKPLAILGASASVGGTMRAQYHLRQTAVYLDMHPLNKPEIFVKSAASAFDAQGVLIDETAKKLVSQQLEALVAWTRKLSARG
jgi:chromate reductase, NAD(P)H dehydrogenase (quinone)